MSHVSSWERARTIVARVCAAVANRLPVADQLGSKLLIDSNPDRLSPLHSFVDVVTLDGMDYQVRVCPHVQEFLSCAAAEKYFKRTLRWVEKTDRYEGFEPNLDVRLAEVPKLPKQAAPGETTMPIEPWEQLRPWLWVRGAWAILGNAQAPNYFVFHRGRIINPDDEIPSLQAAQQWAERLRKSYEEETKP